MPHLAVFLVLLSLVGCAAETLPVDDIPEGMTVEVKRPLVLTDEARVPENDPLYQGVEVYEDRVVLLLAGDPAEPLMAGHVIAGRADGGYLREIVSVGELHRGRLPLETQPARITQFLADGHIVIDYDPPDVGRPTTTDIDDGVAGRSDALGGTVLVGSATGLRCGGGSTASVTIDPQLSIDPEFHADLDVGLGTAFGFLPRPEVKHFELIMGAEIHAGVDISSEGAWSAACEQDLGGLSGSVQLPTATAYVAGIPVIITNEIEPTLELGIEAEVSTQSFHQHMSATFGLTVGVEYTDGEWRSIWEPVAEVSGGVTAGDEEGGSVSASLSLSAGLEYQSRIYGSFGPNVGLEVFVEKEISSTAPDFCDWSEQVEAGLAATFGGEVEIDVGPLDWTVAEIEIAEIDLLRAGISSDSGTFPWCDECTSDVTCVDGLGRGIYLGGVGVEPCGGGGSHRACVCTEAGLSGCGECS